ncbi:MAG: LysM peptidoglycan-binding domain-containing protein [Thermodesulfobacteriota bacterium]|nr:LysM peptidoglycan-binding domain-containing protein [Thermodesulfobacteriota bacterium]
MTGTLNNNGRTILFVTAACAVFIVIVIVILSVAGRSSVSTREFAAMQQRVQALETATNRLAIALEKMDALARQADAFQQFIKESAKRETDLLFRVSDLEAKAGISKAPATETPEETPVSQAPSQTDPETAPPATVSDTPAKPESPAAQPSSATPDGYYTVVKGDTTYSISRRFGLTVDQLLEMNSLKSTNIFPGQALKVKP